MIRTVFNLSFSMVLLMIFNCSDNGEHSPSETDSLTTRDTAFLADKNFVFKNVKNTKEVNIFYRSDKAGSNDPNIYADSTLKKKFVRLSANQCGLLFAPFLAKGYGVQYAKDEMFGWFVSKQNKIGDFQPIIVQEDGVHDYESLTLIILDSNYKAVSSFSLNEESSSIDYASNPHISRSYSILNKNEIVSYRINTNTDSSKKQIITDSNVFKSFVDKNGKIFTKQIVKSSCVKFLKY